MFTHVSDDSPGISRQRAGRGWSYRGADGLITDKAERARIEALVIPPAYEDVWIAPDARNNLQATGRDARGRKQYIYHPDWLAERARAKYDILTDFAAALPTLRRQLIADRQRPDLDERRVLATMVTLLDRSHLRIGNEDYAKRNGTRGLSTLRGKHVEVNGSEMRFRYPGKSGQARDIVLRDSTLAATVGKLAAGPRTPVFRWREGRKVRQATSEDVNAYLRSIAGEEISAKVFRTWAGTVLCAASAPDVALSGRALDAIEYVARHLGNTPNVARDSYIHPKILTALDAGDMREIRAIRPPFGRRDLSVTEQDVAQLIA